MIGTALRYPGGKSRALKTILPLIPEFSEFREPFLGGGSVFIALRQLYPEKRFWINDTYTDLYHFWIHARDTNEFLTNRIYKLKRTELDGHKLYKKLANQQPEKGIDQAVRFFVLNRITFSGTTESGGFSKHNFTERFTDSSIERVKKLESLLQGTKITNADYEHLLPKTEKTGKGVFIYLDPPYLSAKKSRLYGKRGQLHTKFCHDRFAQALKNAKCKWMVTYDDCREVRRLFADANIMSWELQYGMTNCNRRVAPKGKELIITNYSLDDS